MNNLRNIRKKKGYSLSQLHEMTGIPLRSLEDWDAEKRQIQAYHRIKLLAKVLECDMDDLMTKEEDCIHDGKEAHVIMIQEETGVHVLVTDDDFEIFHDTIISREEALELLKHIKDGKDIKPFLY